MVFGLEVIVTYDVPEVLLPEIGHGAVDPPYIKAAVGLRTLVRHRPEYRGTPTIVQLDAT